MQLYVSDYIADTRHLTALEHGSLLLLYMAAWRAGGTLEHNDKKLARIVGCTAAQWKRIGPTILAFFAVEGGNISVAEPGRHIGRRGREPMPPSLRVAIIERDGGVCRYCGDEPETPHIDHIVPVVRGGGNDEDNLCVACPSCNLSKGSKLPGDWLQ